MNLIFLLAQTGLDRLLRDHEYSHAISRESYLESNSALQKRFKDGGLSSQLHTDGYTPNANVSHWYGFHFDFKPANILVSNDKTWLITDFGQSIFTL